MQTPQTDIWRQRCLWNRHDLRLKSYCVTQIANPSGRRGGIPKSWSLDV